MPRNGIEGAGRMRGSIVAVAVIALMLNIAEIIYLIYRMTKIVLYPYSTVIPHWVEIGFNAILFGTLSFIIFLSMYLILAVISKSTGYRRTARLRLSEMMDESKYPTATVAIFTFNEPVDMVKESIENNYLNLKYPRDKLQLAVCDDSTEEEYWKPLSEYIGQLSKKGHKVFLVHRLIRKGRKAGAFNELINNYAKTDYVALCDADYRLNADFLEKTLPFFYTEENLFAVQTPQYFRNSENTWVSRVSMNIQHFFYNFLGTFKDKANSFFFCGTCGIIDLKKAKTVQMEEKAITEDLEVSTEAVTKHGWQTVYIDEVMASGVGPEIMGQLVGQYMRYTRGNLWSLRQHLADIMLSSKITLKQKMHHFHNNSALAMGIVSLIVMLEPVVFLLLDLPGPNIPIILALFLFVLGNFLFYLAYGKSVREFLYHLFFMNVMTIKLAAQFIKGFVLNSPGEFIRTAKIATGEKSAWKRIKYVFSLFWLEILFLTLIWTFILSKVPMISETITTASFDIQSQGIVSYLLNYDIITAIQSVTLGAFDFMRSNSKLAGPIIIFAYFTFWFIGGFYLTFIGGNKLKTTRVTDFVVPINDKYFGAFELIESGEEKEEKKVKPIVIGGEAVIKGAGEEEKETKPAGEVLPPTPVKEEVEKEIEITPLIEKEPETQPIAEMKVAKMPEEVAVPPSAPEKAMKRLGGIKIIARRRNNEWTFFSPEKQVSAKIPDVARKLQACITTDRDLHLLGELMMEDPEELLVVSGIKDHFKLLSKEYGFRVYDVLYYGNDLKYMPEENRRDVLTTILPRAYEQRTKNVGIAVGQ